MVETMKVHSLTILHYGRDYLGYALQSVYHSVDQCHIFYTPTPSHGHSADTPPVETKEELMQAAYAYDPDDKIKWYDMLGVVNEGPQRDLALKTVESAGAELVVVVDCDEVWQQDVLQLMLIGIWENGKVRDNLVNMAHLWRSFNWICYDDGWPNRIIDLRFPARPGVWAYLSNKEFGRIFHFGYATTDQVMRYKWQIHGHKNELRPDWFDDGWARWPPHTEEIKEIAFERGWDISVHPTNEENFWVPEPFDKKQLPEFMRQHPFYGLDKIE